MGRSFVRIGENGFWVHDGLLGSWLRLLALHLRLPNPDEPAAMSDSMKQIRDHWLFASLPFFTGCIPVRLEQAISTDEGKILVREATVSLLDGLSQAPPILPRKILDLLLDFSVVGKSHGFDVETRQLIDVGNAFLDLLDGKITTTAADLGRMPGARKKEESS